MSFVIGIVMLFVSGLGFGFYLGLRFAGQELGRRMRAEIDAGRLTKDEVLRIVK